MAYSDGEQNWRHRFQHPVVEEKPWKLKMLWEKKTQGEVKRMNGFVQHPVKRRPVYVHPFIQETMRKEEADAAAAAASANKSSLAALKALWMNRRRLQIDPEKHVYFLYDPGKQVSSAIKIKNVSRTHVAFKFQTTAPRSCFMRPNTGVLAPNESIMATVVKYLEPMEQDQERKTKEKFKIVSLAVESSDIDYAPELFDHQKDEVSVERILRVVFIDPNSASPELVSRLKRRLAEAEAADAASNKPEKEEVPITALKAGLVVNEWKQRREEFLRQQQIEAGGA